MNTKLDGLSISRRGFLAFAGAASGVALLVPRQILAQDDGLVQMPAGQHRQVTSPSRSCAATSAS